MLEAMLPLFFAVFIGILFHKSDVLVSGIAVAGFTATYLYYFIILIYFIEWEFSKAFSGGFIYSQKIVVFK